MSKFIDLLVFDISCKESHDRWKHLNFFNKNLHSPAVLLEKRGSHVLSKIHCLAPHVSFFL